MGGNDLRVVAILRFLESLRHAPVVLLLAAFLILRDLLRSFKDHVAISEKFVKKRLDASNLDREDFMSYILRHNDEKGMNVPGSTI